MVIDASIGVKWVVPEANSAAAVELLQDGNHIVPALFHVEIGNALWKKARRNEIVLGPILSFYEALPELVQTVSEIPFASRALAIAEELGHPIYDCVYLALAESVAEELVTADQRFLSVISGTSYAQRVRTI